MNQQSLLAMAAGMMNPSERRNAAREFARAVGARDLIIFGKDPMLDVFLPAAGFPQSMPSESEWPEFLRNCGKSSSETALMPDPFCPGSMTTVTGIVCNGRSALLALMDANCTPESFAFLRDILPFLGAGIRSELLAQAERGRAMVLRHSADRANQLARALDDAHRDLQHALVDSQRSRKRISFLADMSYKLAGSLCYKTICANLTRFIVPKLADVALIELVTDDGQIAYLEAHPAPIDGQQLIQKMYGSIGQPPADRPQLRVLKTGTIDQIDLQSRTSGYYAHLHALGISSAVIVPVRARENIIGTILYGMTARERSVTVDEVTMYNQISDRAGILIDNASLYQQARNAIRLRDEFLSIASHELKTPLTSLSLELQFLIRVMKRCYGDRLPAEEALAMLESSQSQALRISTLINTLLDISRIKEGKLKIEKDRADLSEIVRDIVLRFRREAQSAGCELSIDLPDSHFVCLDRLRIEQALSNLISNAIKYASGKPILIKVEYGGMSTTVSVIDHGMGISPMDHTRIFNRFERAVGERRINGLGLGLYITKQIVESHGGRIKLASEPGVGSTFSIVLPVDEAQGEAASGEHRAAI